MGYWWMEIEKKSGTTICSPHHITASLISSKPIVGCEVQVSHLMFYCGALCLIKHTAQWEMSKREADKEKDPPGGEHVSKHGGSGNPHSQTWHGANHLKPKVKTSYHHGDYKTTTRSVINLSAFCAQLLQTFSPVLLHSPRWSHSSCCWVLSCRCRYTPQCKPAWTLLPWRWARSTGWCRRCLSLEKERGVSFSTATIQVKPDVVIDCATS